MSVIHSIQQDQFFFHYSKDEKLPESSIAMHAHVENEIFYFLGGKGTMVVEGNPYELQEGQILIMRSHEFHKPEISMEVPYERMVIQFTDEYIHTTDPQGLLLAPFCDRPLGRSNAFDAEMTKRSLLPELMKRVAQGEERDGYAQRLCCYHNTMAILEEIGRLFRKKQDETPENGKFTVVQQVISYIEEHLNEKISLDLLQKEFFVNKFHLNRIFQSATGSTVGEYIIMKRLLLARKFIRMGYIPMSACTASGFGDYSSFYRAYVKHFQISPKEERDAYFEKK